MHPDSKKALFSVLPLTLPSHCTGKPLSTLYFYLPIIFHQVEVTANFNYTPSTYTNCSGYFLSLGISITLTRSDFTEMDMALVLKLNVVLEIAPHIKHTFLWPWFCSFCTLCLECSFYKYFMTHFLHVHMSAQIWPQKDDHSYLTTLSAKRLSFFSS